MQLLRSEVLIAASACKCYEASIWLCCHSICIHVDPSVNPHYSVDRQTFVQRRPPNCSKHAVGLQALNEIGFLLTVFKNFMCSREITTETENPSNPVRL